jgi:predicted esterase
VAEFETPRNELVSPSNFANTLREAGSGRGVAFRAAVLLHGRGHTPDEKVDLTARLGTLEGMRWLAPGADLGSWYPGRFRDPVSVNEPYLSEAVRRCHEAVIEAGEDGRLGPEQLAVVGFSQGACVALEYLRRYPERVRTVVVFTGGLMGPPADWRPEGSLEGVRVLLTGSDADDWIPEEDTRETGRVVESYGAQVTLRVYHSRAHVVGDEELAESRTLLEQLGTED